MPLPPAPTQRASRLTHKAFEQSSTESSAHKDLHVFLLNMNKDHALGVKKSSMLKN